MEIVDVASSRRAELLSIDDAVGDVLARSGVREGVVHLWALHTTCALTVNESADPDVARDMAEKMDRLAPKDEAFYRHAEGNSDSHVKTSLFGPGLTLLVHDGRLVLGTWQGIFLCEWDGPRTRRVVVKAVEC